MFPVDGANIVTDATAPASVEAVRLGAEGTLQELAAPVARSGAPASDRLVREERSRSPHIGESGGILELGERRR